MIEIILYGTCRHGNVFPSYHIIEITEEDIPTAILGYRELYPTCIHVRVDVAFPDPDFIKGRSN